MSRSPRAARTEEDAPPTDWLAELPHELHLRILEGVDDFSDCAAFSLASPRLGLALRSGLARFEDPLFAVAMRLLLIERFAASLGSSIMDTLSEATLRKYTADRRANADHFPWLARVSPALRLTSEVEGAEVWRLRRGEVNDAKLRMRLLRSGQVQHFEGERGAERLVRLKFASGQVQHFEGDAGAERKVRTVFADGAVAHYEGEKGAERVVRVVCASGSVQYYEDERGAERLVRKEFSSGEVKHFEGERGAERKVRAELANGQVHHYEGEQGAERKVRTEFASGTVKYYEGEKGAERKVRTVPADGQVQYCEGQ
ncbi:hypothetical protein EMIHUDRAFT_365780 [Emiliania huxleyi CCMP1516]|uniref:F-box domain-containing protein n=2 Tax=Emiliania huxleyi TaxID=2903 RepID=A0A0D3K1H7_EMIH1|nr:hypothetical protein EMIHUDRAFT_365780 [Emiliania huxleyi CCMP1516]EOD29612.1 hypothetical protein EMIHUDRAFT_365780 [Emiliania huxleyi CCMP1516]|eukprot:XP_005782041.1 hypothetical protein EMIHUDRAFT_365780 [Emiliania huxleyi CCMP1516]